MKSQLEIKLEKDECFWGGLVTDGIMMPYKASKLHRSLDSIVTPNQTMPFLLSNKGRYLWCDEPMSYTFTDTGLLVESDYGKVVLSDKHGSLKEAYLHAAKNHFPLKGQFPDKRLFKDAQFNTWIELMYDQREEKILNYANDIIKHGYDPGVLMIDDNWQEDYGVFAFHPGRFQNPKSMIQKLHDLGFSIMLWVSPFISPDSAIFRELEKKNMLIKNPDATTAIRHWWNGYSGILDLTNPATKKWLSEQLDRLISDYGVDGFKFDAGDPEFYKKDDNQYALANGQKQCHAYAEFGAKYPLNEFRASFKAANLPLAQRLCDKNHHWTDNGIDTLIPNALAQGLMGYIYTCPDMIGGGEYTNFLPDRLNLDEELVVRYAQCSALFPMMQFSVAPWRVLSPKHAKICLDMAKLHKTFESHFLHVVEASSLSGEPILRHMAYEYGEGYEEVKDQFLIGSTLLVAPVITQNTYAREVHLPKGLWVCDQGKLYEGPVTMTIDVPIERLPYFILTD